jgi:ABC-type dipeptide/oligopeptide/nickel transport system permease component
MSPKIFIFILQRIIAAIPILLGVVLVTFVLVRILPGDPATFFANAPGMGPEEIAEISRELGLNKSLPEQLIIFVSNILDGNLGKSLATGQPVTQDLAEKLPASAELSIVALIFALLVSIPLGVISAVNAGSTIDHAVRFFSTISAAMPPFVTGLVLMLLFFYQLGWVPEPIGRIDIFLGEPTPVTGFYLIDSLIEGDSEKLYSAASQLFLPALTMALFVIAPLTRMTRASMLGVLGSDFIRSARAVGLKPYTIYMTYAFRNAMIPILTTMGMVFSFMLGANVLVEKVFAWPGIGSYALQGMMVSDYAPIQGFVLLMGGLYVMLNLIIDILYGLIDPRIQVG